MVLPDTRRDTRQAELSVILVPYRNQSVVVRRPALWKENGLGEGPS